MSYTIPKKCQCEREIVYNIQPLTGLVTDISHLTPRILYDSTATALPLSESTVKN